MDILKRIRKFLDEEGKHPWVVGLSVDGASPEALTAWRMLSIEERLAISQKNPFFTERNEVLLKLWSQGFSQELLAELSGLSVATIKRKVSKKKLKK